MGFARGRARLGLLPLLAPVRDGPEDPDRVFGGSPNVSGAEGPERIAPAGGAPQGDSAIPPGSIATRREEAAHPSPGGPAASGRRPSQRGRPGRFDTLLGPGLSSGDDDAPCAFGRQARLRAFRGSDRPSPRPDGEDPGPPR